MTEFAQEVSLHRVSSLEDFVGCISGGIEQGLRFPFEKFLQIAAVNIDAERAASVVQSCERIGSLVERGLHDVARDYQRILSWAQAVATGTPQALVAVCADDLAAARVPAQNCIVDLGGGVLYAGRLEVGEVAAFRQEASTTSGAKIFCYMGNGLAALPLPCLIAESIGDPKIDFVKLINHGVMWMGSALKGQAFLSHEGQISQVLGLLGAEKLPGDPSH